jgi:hypothetical protein
MQSQTRHSHANKTAPHKVITVSDMARGEGRELSEQNHCCTPYPADYFMSSLIGMSFKYTENQCAPTHTACENLNVFHGKKF